MIQVLLIRHGATAGNLEKRYIGSTDEALCQIGIAQIARVREQHLQADSLYISPMLRTRQTAELLFPQMSPICVRDFREMDFGIFEGKTADELSTSLEYRKWVASMCMDPVPQGESVSTFKTRCCLAFEAIMDRIPDGSCAAFVVHGGVIMSILEAYAQPKKGFYDYHFENGETVCCLYDTHIKRLQINESDKEKS